MTCSFGDSIGAATLPALFMRLLDRYLVRELMLPLGICLGGFLLFWVAFDLFSELNSLQQQHAGFADIARLYWLRLPQLLLTILPVGLLLALLYALTQHARHQELTAMRAAGVGIWRICLPYYVVGLLFSGALYLVNEVIAPDAREKEDTLRASWSDPGISEPGRAWRNNISFFNHAELRSWSLGGFNLETGELRQARVAFFLPPNARQELVADGARWNAPSGTNGVWVLTNAFELVFRSSDDPSPARRRRPMQVLNTTELGADASALTNWPFHSKSGLTNGVLYAGLRQDGAGKGPSWDVEQYSSATGELRGLHGSAPMESGARRIILAEAGLYTNSAWHLYRSREYLYRSGSDVYPLETASDELVIPNLTETPEIIRSEIRVTGLLRQSRLLKKPELAAYQIRDYQRLHPNLRPGDWAILETQLQAHLAAPWTCLVVTFIAVPFAAPSGRRNLFYGVAGSIALAFGYFVIQRLGFAIGQRGIVTPWLAAWLPNLFFGLLGLGLTTRVR